MSTFEVLVYAGVAYCLLDFILGIALKRCVLPGLRCKVCRDASAKKSGSAA